MSLYSVWAGMKNRCNNPSFKDKGSYYLLSYDDSWELFENFSNDMHEGYASGLTLDRIDNNLGYSKENCRWISLTMQSRNRACVKLSTERVAEIRNKILQGRLQGALAKEYSVSQATISYVANNKIWQEDAA